MPSDTFAKNIIAKALGAFWILDGLLQLQPAMFGQAFPNNVLVPLLDGEPAFLHMMIALGIEAWDTNTLIANALAALLQIGIGVLLFSPLDDARFKTGAYISIAWGLVVWLCGEAAGLLFTGAASFYAGAPGAVLVYVLLAALLLMPRTISATVYPKVAAWALLFAAALQLQPLFWTPDGAQQVAMASTMEAVPAFVALPTYLLNLISSHAITSNIMLIAIPLCIGLALLFKPNRITGALALVFLFFTWWIGQDFGQLSSIFYNTPTDPQLSPLMALCVVPLFVTADLTQKGRNKLDTALIILGVFSGILLLGVILYGVVVVTIQNTAPMSAPAPMQMHMSG